MKVWLGIDVGKTNLRLGVFDATLRLLERWSVPSGNPQTAGEALHANLLELSRRYTVETAGISLFGPLQTDPKATDYGAIPESSDALWNGVNLPLLVAETLRRPVYFDYDVSAGALGEAVLGAGRDTKTFVYLSVGTGIGGVFFRDTLHPGYAPQLGHMYLPREPDDLTFPGTCRFHGACLQGLASGRALAQRWGMPPEDLPPEHPAWDLEARYLARACANLVYTFAPQRILLGSSVSSAPDLIARINSYLPLLLNGFLDPELRSVYAAQAVVAKAAFTPDSSLLGAALLARNRAGLVL